MYRVLIAEDDSTIRRGLVKLVGEMELPVERILEAENGQSALAVYESFLPQIIITDIRMPLMDGLELIQTIRLEQPNVAFVIISGYNDFEYARKAIQYGVKEYLLKPTDTQELKAVLERIVSQLDAQKEAARQRIRETKAFTDQIEQYQKSLIWDVMLGQNNPAELARKVEMLKGAIPDGMTLAAAGYGGGDQGRDLASRLALALPEGRVLLSGATAYRYQFALLWLNPDAFVHGDILKTVQSRVAAIKKPTFSAYTVALALAEEHARIPAACRICRSLLDTRLVAHTGGQVLIQGGKPQPIPPEEPSLLVHSIRHAMETGDYKRIERIIKDFFSRLLAGPGCTPDALVRSAKILELSVLAYTAEQYRYYEQQLNQLQTIEFLLSASAASKDFVDAIVSRITTIGKNAKPHDTVSPVEQVIQYVQRHFAKDITLVYAANLANMNTSYFSTLFKRKTGLTFVAYLQQVRIDRAKALLKDPSFKVYEIAERVGFQNEKYFMKVFKTLTGRTPSEYKQEE